jgi:nucleotide-binding universal stress UspA family protein
MEGRAVSTVLAAIDDSAAARPVLATACALAPLWDAVVEAVQVVEDGGGTARAAAAAAHVQLRMLGDGDVATRLAEVSREQAVVAIVIGARGRPKGRRPAGHVIWDLITRCEKPVVVVPPDARVQLRVRRILLALEGTSSSSKGIEPILELAKRLPLELVAVHVDDEEALPRFSDQVQHETSAFSDEFLARYGTGSARLELRVGTPAEEVLRTAEELDADLLVLAWSRNLAPGRAHFVRQALERSRIPLLLLPVEI